MELDLAPFYDTNADVGLPQSDVEVTLHKIFLETLKIDPSQPGVTHDLFSLGLNSLLTVQAAVAVGESFKFNLGLNNIYLRSVSLTLIVSHCFWLMVSIGQPFGARTCRATLYPSLNTSS